MEQIEFGYLPERIDITVGDISITTLPDFLEATTDIRNDPRVRGGWIYMNSSCNSGRVFSLPKTHLLSHKSSDSQQHLDFLVWCLSFFMGIRLTTSQAGFLDTTPIETGKLVDFLPCKVERVIRISERFWQDSKNNDEKIKTTIGVINALFMAQNQKHLCFERFIYLYTALDACYWLAEKAGLSEGAKTHKERIKIMCNSVGLAVPSWAEITDSKAKIADIRNNTLHQALFLGEPLGFAAFVGSNPDNKDITLGMCDLICRFLVALLVGKDCAYVKSPIEKRCMHALEF